MTPARRVVRVALRQAFGPPEQVYVEVESFGAAAARIHCRRGAILRFEWVDADLADLAPALPAPG